MNEINTNKHSAAHFPEQVSQSCVLAPGTACTHRRALSSSRPGPLSKNKLALAHTGQGGCCGLRCRLPLSQCCQCQLPLLHVYVSPPEPSLELSPALLHPLHLFPPHPPFLVYNRVPESFYQGLKSHLYLLPSPGLRQSILPTWLHVGCGTVNTTYDFSK